MHCKDVSFHEVDFELSERNIRESMDAWVAYTRTEYVVFRNGEDHAVVCVHKSSGKGLFRKLSGYEIISLPEETVFVSDPDLDVLNQPAMAEIQSRYPDKTVVVQGMFSHINFISGLKPVRLKVIDNIPPSPSKLGVLVRRALSSGFVDHPIIVDDHVIDMADHISEVRTEAVMFPCKVSGLTADMPVYFLDSAPKIEHEVTLIGCHLSERIYESLYREKVAFINVCPMDFADGSVKTIVKCCKIKEGFVIEGNVAKVPWGATVPEVVGAINSLFDQ